MQNTSAKTLIDVNSGLRFAKSPRWVGRKLVFLDVHDRCIKSADLYGSLKAVRVLPYVPGGFGLLADGTMMVGDAWRRKMYRWSSAGSMEVADMSNDASFCIGDIAVDSRGDMYISDVGFDFLDPLADPVPNGVIVHVGADGRSSIVAGNLFSPNGMLITPDNSTLIVAETFGHRLTAYEIQKDGSLRNRRVWAQFEGDVKPDGICLDLDGAIWLAGSGSCAYRVQEGGEIDQQITTERPVFATMLGGPHLRHLFLCTSDSNDPAINRRFPSATIDVAEVATPGIELPGQNDCNEFVASSSIKPGRAPCCTP